MKLPKIPILDKMSDQGLERLFMVCVLLATLTIGMLIGVKMERNRYQKQTTAIVAEIPAQEG